MNTNDKILQWNSVEPWDAVGVSDIADTVLRTIESFHEHVQVDLRVGPEACAPRVPDEFWEWATSSDLAVRYFHTPSLKAAWLAHLRAKEAE